MVKKSRMRNALFAVALVVCVLYVPHGVASAHHFAWTQTPDAINGDINITTSSDGSVLSFAVNGGDIYVSTTTGATWTDEKIPGADLWYALASSADGSVLVATQATGYVYVSTSTGATWTKETAPGSKEWTAVTASSDGSTIAIAASPGDIYVSTTTGATWTDEATSGSLDWQALTSSSDGSHMAAAVWGGGIYVSTTTGATWTKTNAPDEDWISITSSADGSHLAAASYSDASFTVTNGTIWTSSDYGATWTEQTGIAENGWYWISSSADGQVLAAAAGWGYGQVFGALPEGNIYTSLDGGVHWALEPRPGQAVWGGVALTPDGKHIAATGIGVWTGVPGGAFVEDASSPPVAPTLSIQVTGTTTATIQLSSQQSNGVSTVGYAYHASGGATTTQSYAANGSITVQTPLEGLSCNTTYTIWGFATNDLGTTDSTAQTVTTQPCPPGSVSSDTVPQATSTAGTSFTRIPSTSSDSVVASASAISTSTPPVFATDLTVGAQNAEVHALQEFLIGKSLGPAAVALAQDGATSYFGAHTKAALIEYQKAVGITPASGYFGPITRAYIASHPD